MATLREQVTAIVREMVGPIARAAVDKAVRELPKAEMIPGTVVQSQQQAQYGEGLALVHVDGDPPGELRHVSVIDGRRYSAGTRVMVEYQPPAGAVIRGAIDCQDRIEVLRISSAAELVTGDRSAPGTFLYDATMGPAVLDVTDPIGSDLVVAVEHPVGTVVATITLPAGDTRVEFDFADYAMRYADGPAFFEVTDDGGGGWTAITLAIELTVGCAQSEEFTWGGGAE